jgi:hypothetical protein
MKAVKKGRVYEDYIAEQYGRRQPLSGGNFMAKEDVLGEDRWKEFLFQTKNHSGKESITIKLEDLINLKRNASMIGRVGVYIFTFGEENQFVVLRKRDWEKLVPKEV